MISTANTNDGKIQIIYLAGYPSTIYQKSFDGSNWSSGYSVATISSGYLNAHSLSAVSNDLFVIFKESSSNYVKYRQYDAVPLAPQNLTVTAETQSGYSHPKLTWSLNNEPDVYSNTGVAYRIERRFDYNGTGNWTAWTQIATKDGTTNQFIDDGVNGAGNGPNHVQYKLKAQDIGENQSAYSSSAGIAYGFFEKSSANNKLVTSYELGQNYPNPFNPTTRISYQIPVAGNVSLKVFDVLGKEVVELVNETKEAGYYEVEFSAKGRASNLPSGVYIYRINAGKFTAVNKMILMR